MTTIFPLTHCRHCGQAVRRIDGTLYRTDVVLIHTCTPPPPPALTIDNEDKAHG